MSEQQATYSTAPVRAKSRLVIPGDREKLRTLLSGLIAQGRLPEAVWIIRERGLEMHPRFRSTVLALGFVCSGDELARREKWATPLTQQDLDVIGRELKRWRRLRQVEDRKKKEETQS